MKLAEPRWAIKRQTRCQEAPFRALGGPESLVERDARAARPWSRFIANNVPVEDGLPDAIDISATGTDHLQHLPTNPVRY